MFWVWICVSVSEYWFVLYCFYTCLPFVLIVVSFCIVFQCYPVFPCLSFKQPCKKCWLGRKEHLGWLHALQWCHLNFTLTLTTGGKDADSWQIQIQTKRQTQRHAQIQMGGSSSQRCHLNFTLAQLVAKMLTQPEPAETTIRIENQDCGFTLNYRL